MSKTQNIHDLILSVSEILSWVNSYTKSAEQAELFSKLVKSRRELKRVYRALVDKPTIAAYGESQVGKSYIISSLLSSPGHPFTILDDDGTPLNFIDSVNEKTQSQESTGVVTRFTSSEVAISKQFPVKVKLLSVADLITILADCFMVDVKGYDPYREDEWNSFADKLMEDYSESKDIQDSLTEDEIGDIEEYLYSHNRVQAANLKNANFFGKVAMLIRKVPAERWIDVFSPLWKQEKTFSALFEKVVQCYKSIGFSNSVFISTKAVLNDFNDGEPTLMSVKVLQGLAPLLDGCEVAFVPVMLPDGQTVKIAKCLLSAMTEEAVYHVDPSVLSQPVLFDFEGIHESPGRSRDEIVRYLKELGFDKTYDKRFLNQFDLLDFPGARGRASGYSIEQIKVEIVKLLLRSKVTYLFNNYSRELKLSVLLFCHHYKNTTPNLVAPLLNSWILTYVGENYAERKKNMEKYKGIPPLFLISTMYNKDIAFESDSSGGISLDSQIWQRRLDTIWDKEVIDSKANQWFDKWVSENSRFDNMFLLRDFKFSSDLHGYNKIFSGYPGKETREYDVAERQQLKGLFLRDTAVRRFFKDPEVAWDMSSTKNNDGSYHIVQRLFLVSKDAIAARAEKFYDQVSRSLKDIDDAISPKFKKDTGEKRLLENITKARRFDFTVRRVVEKKNDFFGHMIQFLQLNPHFTASVFNKVVHSTQIPTETEVQEYELLIDRAEQMGYHFDPGKDEEYNKEVFVQAFGFDPEEEDIDIRKLARASYRRVCTASSVMANELITSWLNVLNSADRSFRFSQVGFKPMVFTSFIENVEAMCAKVKIRDRIAASISEFVDTAVSRYDQNESMIADMASSIFNSFIMDMGYSLLSESDLENARSIVSKEGFNLAIFKQGDGENNASGDAARQRLFESLKSLGDGEGGQLKKLPSYQHMSRWIDCVIIAFIAASDVVLLDDDSLIANEKLGNILETFKSRAIPFAQN